MATIKEDYCSKEIYKNKIMAQYISKDALVAEIDNILDYVNEYWDTDYAIGAQRFADKLQDVINTFEVKEVDLDFMLHEYWNLSSKISIDCLESATMTKDEMINFAKHFFELGLRSTITEEDCKLVWNIGDKIPYMPEEEFFKELLKRYKAQKGE